LQYGLIYHSTFIGRAGPKHKGRISRFLANKCSIASRIDCYSGRPLRAPLPFLIDPSFFVDSPTAKFGEALRAQVEERLNFFETGAPPSKNADAIRKVLESLALDEDDEDDEMAETDPILPLIEPTPKKEKKKKRKSDAMDIDGEEDGEEDDHSSKKVKLSKEEKKALKKARKEKKEAKALAKTASGEVGCLCLSKIANAYPIS
jgi:nucleolar protein 56